MAIKAILFDLDGTLLPMDLRTFQLTSGRLSAEKMKTYGYTREEFGKANWSGILAMKENDGSRINADVFREKLAEILGERILEDYHHLMDFYANEFEQVQEVCGYTPEAGKTIEKLRKMGFRLVMATTPWFPRSAIEHRLRWAGVDPKAFEMYTLIDNSRYCKPNPGYYQDILNRLGLPAEECLMVGNDVSEDMAARELGMQVFLLTNNLINKHEVDISEYPKGTFAKLMQFILENK